MQCLDRHETLAAQIDVPERIARTDFDELKVFALAPLPCQNVQLNTQYLMNPNYLSVYITFRASHTPSNIRLRLVVKRSHNMRGPCSNTNPVVNLFHMKVYY